MIVAFVVDPGKVFDDVIAVIEYPLTAQGVFVSLVCCVYVSRSHAQKPDTAECKMKMYGTLTSSWFPGV